MSVAAAVLVALAVFLTARLVLAGRRRSRIERRIDAHVAGAVDTSSEQPAELDRLDGRLDRLERKLARRRWWEAIERRVVRAGIGRRPLVVAAVVGAVCLLALLLAALAGSGAAVVLALAVPPLLAWAVLGALAQRRLRAFDEQLPELLSALGSSLRAGHGFLQSLQGVANDAPEPAGSELRRALAETRVGRPVEEALGAISERVPSRDFAYVLTAIAVQRQVGGSLAGLFDVVNDTVRHRQQFTRKVRALTATGRMSAYALLALPFGVALLLSLINHDYLAPMLHSHGGRLMLLVGLCSMGVGAVFVRRIVSFKG